MNIGSLIAFFRKRHTPLRALGVGAQTIPNGECRFQMRQRRSALAALRLYRCDHIMVISLGAAVPRYAPDGDSLFQSRNPFLGMFRLVQHARQLAERTGLPL